jgi:hypothetical protein
VGKPETLKIEGETISIAVGILEHIKETGSIVLKS